MDGATVLAQSLYSQGIEYAFGIVGIPVVEVAVAFQAVGIKFVAMRNEQSASYAASAIGYLTGKPGVCLVVSGPGFVHALAGLSNANENCWPVIVIGGASDSHLDGSEAFQEFPQVSAAAKFCKYAARLPSIARIPHFVHKAVKESTYGRPGAVYLDLPGDFVNASVATEDVLFPSRLPPPPTTLAEPHAVARAADLLRGARRPLLVIGKGAAYDRAEAPVRRLVDACRLPFLPTPMGKGVAPDGHACCVAAARTRALRSADLVLLLGARLNWILHFGRPPRLSESAKFVQVDIHAEEFHTNVNCEVALCGNISAVVDQLTSALDGYQFASDSEWWRELHEAGAKNRARVQALVAAGQTVPMTYYSVMDELARFLGNDDWLVVSEGANTMDIGRTMLANQMPRRRLDAGTFGTMGVGPGFGIAAELLRRGLDPAAAAAAPAYRRVLCLEGDSAVGFSLAELETMARYRLPVLLVVVNNCGIYSGVPAAVMDELRRGDAAAAGGDLALRLPATALSADCRYDLVAEALGGVGRLVRSVAELRAALAECAGVADRPCLINAMIDTGAERKQQEFDWLSRSKL